MGEYITDVPNTNPTMTDDLKAFLSEATGFPPEKIRACMFLADVVDVDDPDKPGQTMEGITYGGNLTEEGMLALTAEAARVLYQALRLQAIADMVPDDLSGLDEAA